MVVLVLALTLVVVLVRQCCRRIALFRNYDVGLVVDYPGFAFFNIFQ